MHIAKRLGTAAVIRATLIVVAERRVSVVTLTHRGIGTLDEILPGYCPRIDWVIRIAQLGNGYLQGQVNRAVTVPYKL